MTFAVELGEGIIEFNNAIEAMEKAEELRRRGVVLAYHFSEDGWQVNEEQWLVQIGKEFFIITLEQKWSFDPFTPGDMFTERWRVMSEEVSEREAKRIMREWEE